MKFNAVALTVVAAVAGVHAQSSTASSAAPTSTNGISPCILTCIEQAASANGCSNAFDVTCLCSNTQFQQSARSCLESSCTSADLQAAEALESAECGAASSAASSAAASATSTIASLSSSAASSESSLASSISSAISSASSALASGASSLSSRISSATSAASSAASSAATQSQTSNAAVSGMRADWGAAKGGFVGVGVAVLGVVVGAAFVL